MRLILSTSILAMLAAALAAASTVVMAQQQSVEPSEIAIAPKPTAEIVPTKSNPSPHGVIAKKATPRANWVEVYNFLEKKRAESLAATSNKIRGQGLVAVDENQLENFKSVDREQLERSDVPILVPIMERTASGTRVFTHKNTYTAVIELGNGAWIEMIGTPLRVIASDEKFARRRLSERTKRMRALPALETKYLISKHEEGIDLSFSKFNVAYMISVYCEPPDSDPRCSDDAYITSLASSVALLNPGQGDVQ